MKNTFSPFAKLVAIAACALTLGSCSRSDYAMLPKGGSYHGVSRVATPVPAKAERAAAVATSEAVVAPEVAIAPAPAAAIAQPKAAAKTAKVTAPAVAGTVGTAATVAAPAPKTTLAQRIALNTVTRKIDKLVQKSGAMKKHENTAATSKLQGKLRQGIILVLIGVLVEILAAAIGSSIVYLLGALLILIGLVLIVLYLLDEV